MKKENGVFPAFRKFKILREMGFISEFKRDMLPVWKGFLVVFVFLFVSLWVTFNPPNFSVLVQANKYSFSFIGSINIFCIKFSDGNINGIFLIRAANIYLLL